MDDVKARKLAGKRKSPQELRIAFYEPGLCDMGAQVRDGE
jgi:hypothetical protein